jgi:5'-nucleotidase
VRRIILLVAFVSLLGGCSATATSATVVETAPPPMMSQLAPVPPRPIVVLVTDGGDDPAGFDALVVALEALPYVTVTIDSLGQQPDVVVVGTGSAPTIGPSVEHSALVAAASDAARRGLPAIAVSAGGNRSSDFAAAARLAANEVDDHRADFGSGTNLDQVVVNLNSPSCTPGTTVRGVVDVPVAPESPVDSGAPAFDCSSEMIEFQDDVSALAVGYASRSLIRV